MSEGRNQCTVVDMNCARTCSVARAGEKGARLFEAVVPCLGVLADEVNDDVALGDCAPHHGVIAYAEVLERHDIAEVAHGV